MIWRLAVNCTHDFFARLFYSFQTKKQVIMKKQRMSQLYWHIVVAQRAANRKRGSKKRRICGTCIDMKIKKVQSVSGYYYKEEGLP